MDILSTPQNNSRPKTWPEVPAVRGQTYSVNDPIFPSNQLVVMLFDTWVDFGTVHEQLRRKVAVQDTALIQLKTTNDVLTQQLADLQTKHHNLKEATRTERTAKAMKHTNLKDTK